MFGIKNRNPIVSLVIGLCMLTILFMMMQHMLTLVNKLSEKNTKTEDYDLGRTYFMKEDLDPFAKYGGKRKFEELKPDIEKVFDVIDKATRPELKSFIALQSPWERVFESTYKYVGVLLPAYPREVVVNEALPKMSKGHWLSIKLKGDLKLNVLVGEIPEKISKEESYYLDTFYLGQFKMSDGSSQAFAMSKKLYALPNQGVYPKLKSDEEAFLEIYDERADPDLAHKVAPLAFYHFLAKVQEGELEKAEVSNVRYSDLLGSPARYRGRVIEFTGSFIHYIRRRMPSDQIKPGMEFYYQCYLKDNQQKQIAFRSLYLPDDIEMEDVVKVRGYFIQQHNFLSRMKKWKWVPLLIVDKVEKVEEAEHGLTPTEEKIAMVGISLFFVLVIYVTFVMRRPSAKAHRPKEKLEFRKDALEVRTVKKLDRKKPKLSKEKKKDDKNGEEKPEDNSGESSEDKAEDKPDNPS